MGKIKFALYKYSTKNIGDEVQSIAARRFLPRVDYYIDRDEVGSWRNPNSNEKVKLIANGWYMHEPFLWPPTDSTLDLLPISMHVADDDQSVNIFDSKKSKEYLKGFDGVGARDMHTKDFFCKNGIDAYFSGCMTLTLQKDPDIKRQDFILAVDVSPEIVDFMRSKTDRPIIEMTTMFQWQGQDVSGRMAYAEQMLYMYQSSHAIVTTRLHAMLPSLAFETPVLFLSDHESSLYDPSRYSGLDELVRKATTDEYIANYELFNLDKPGKNPDSYKGMREALIKKTTEFTGYNNDQTWRTLDLSDIRLPLVSVVVPVYNVEKYLDECVDSIVGQTYRNIEIILVNDRSTDSSGKKCDKWAKKDSRIKVVHNQVNQGLNMARRVGFKNSTGVLVTFLDSDDVFMRRAIEELMGLYKKTHADILMAGIIYCDENMNLLDDQPFHDCEVTTVPYQYSNQEMMRHFLLGLHQWRHSNNPTTVYCKLFKRDILDEINWELSDFNIGEDDFHSLLTFRAAKSTVVINKPIIKYRINMNSLSRSDKFLYKYKGAEISAFDLCKDFEKLALKTLGKDYEEEIYFKVYSLYNYYINNIIEKRVMTTNDIDVFDRYFPANHIMKIKNYPINRDLVSALKQGGLTRYLQDEVLHLRQDNKEKQSHIDMQYEYLSVKDDEINSFSGVKRSARLFVGNIKRKIQKQMNTRSKG